MLRKASTVPMSLQLDQIIEFVQNFHMFCFPLKYTHHSTNKPHNLSYTLCTNVKEIT